MNITAVVGGFRLGAGQRLSDNGSVAGDLTMLGLLSPGASIGRLTNNGTPTLRGLMAIELTKNSGV